MITMITMGTMSTMSTMKAIAIAYLLTIPLLAMGDHPGMSPSIQEVKKQHESKLMRMPGVVSVGIGLGSGGEEAIVVGMSGPNRTTEAKIPATLDGFPVKVQIVGPIKAQ